MTTSVSDSQTLADDLLEGAKAIASFTGKDPRQIFYIAGKPKAERELPIFRLNGKLHARKTRLLRAIQALEDGE